LPFSALLLKNSIIKSSNDGLEISIDSCEKLAELSALIVIVGLCLEIAVALFHMRHWATVLADVLVAVGVASEVLFGRMGRARQKELHRRLEEKLAHVNERAADSNKIAKKAQLALEKYRAPRTLTGEQITSIAEKLRPFSGQAYDLRLPKMLGPRAALDTQLIAALCKAGWKLQSFQGRGPRRMLDPTVVMFSMENLLDALGRPGFSVPQIEVGNSDGVIGVYAGFEAGDSLEAHVALLNALYSVGVNVGDPLSLSPPRPGVLIPPKAGPTTVHLIIGSRS
jgi:hypothetical protein